MNFWNSNNKTYLFILIKRFQIPVKIEIVNVAVKI